MLDAVLDLLSSAVISPLFFCYAYLLNDQWRIPRWGLAALAAASGLNAQIIAGFTAVPVAARIGFIMLCNVAALLLCSRVRDARFLFVLCTAGMFMFMMTADCGIFAYPLGIHRFYVRLVMDGLVLGVSAVFFRKGFLEVFRSVGRGWAFLSLFPVTLGGVFAVLLIQPGYLIRYAQPETRLIAGAFSLLAVVVYGTFFRFFQLLNAQQQTELDRQLLQAQLETLERELGERKAEEERVRILRHDLRHHLHMLAACLEQGDLDAAGRVAENLAEAEGLSRLSSGEGAVAEEEGAAR